MQAIQGKSEIDVLERVTGIVLAGGQGTRLFPLTQTRCKPAVSFGGHYRLIDIPLSNAINSHIYRLFVLSQHFASDLLQHLQTTYQMDLIRKGGVEMLCPEECADSNHWFNGTADAVRKNLTHLLKSPVDYFLILSGDQLYNMDFREMIRFAETTDADLVIASKPVVEAEAKRMGLLKIDANAHITDFIEKPQDPQVLKKFQLPLPFLKKQSADPHYLGSMGIYIFKRVALINLLKEAGNDFGKELIPIQVKKGKTFAFLYHGYWEDIGTIASYYHANLALATGEACLDTYDESHPIFLRHQHLPSPLIRHASVKDSFIGQGTILEGAEISNSIIGVRSHIKKGTVIRDSILIGNQFYKAPLHQSPPLPADFVIGENCLITRAIIDEHCSLGKGVQLINKDNLQTFDGDGVYIRDGIIIVTTGTHLPDGFII